MPSQDFSHVTTWVFDLDNTLYHPSARLFDQIEKKMTAWMMRALGLSETEANRLRLEYWRSHGTTLSGLMREHDVDPGPYLSEVHEINLDHLERDPELNAHIRALPGRKIVYTNGSGPYAERVLEARGLSGLFEAIYGIEHADFLPKPEAAAYRKIFGADGLDPARGAMFEDDPRNLAAPHAMGLRCVHVAETPVEAPHVHYHTNDLSGFLKTLV